MVKDLVGNELYETDIVQVDLTATRCIGIIKEVHRDRPKRRGGVDGPRSGYVRVIAHFDVPFEDSDALLSSVVKVMNPDHHKRVYGHSQGEPVKKLRDLQKDAWFDSHPDQNVSNLLP